MALPGEQGFSRCQAGQEKHLGLDARPLGGWGRSGDMMDSSGI